MMPIEARPIVVVILIALLTALQRLINIKKDYRGRQTIFTYLSPLIVAAEIVLAYLFFDKVTFSEESYLFEGEIVVWNIAVYCVFIILKCVLCPIFRGLWAKRARMEMTSDNWYEYDEEHDAWFLKERFRSIRTVFNVFAWICVFICTVILAMAWTMGPNTVWWIKAFPVVAVIIVTEIYNLLSGYTKSEYSHTVHGDDIGATVKGAYFKLKEIYEKMFPSALLISHTGNEYSGKTGATELIKSLSSSDDPIENTVGLFFRGLKKKDGLFDVDMIEASNTMLHNKSVIVFNPFYRDISDYILLPIINCLINSRKCLVIVGRGSLCSDVVSWLQEIISNYCRTTDLWRVAELSKNAPECEVGVLTFSQIYETSVLSANTDFFNDSGIVLLIEPSKMITTSQAGLSIIVEKMNKEIRPTFCICDHDIDGLVDVMSHVLQTEITDVVAAPVPRSVYTAMGWSASGDFMRQKLFDKQTHYLGNGIELAAVAIKNQIPSITWYSSEKAPVKDIRWIAGQYYPQICRYTHMQNQQKSLDEHLHFSSNLWGSVIKQDEFVIVEDELCNLFASMRAYLTRGESQCFVNVISENYLLRDYMRYNRQLFMSDPKAVPAFAPHYAKTERNTVLRLILMMACDLVPEEYIAHELSMLGYDTEDVFHTLSGLIFRYTFVADTIITVQNRQELDDELVPIQVCCYSISQQLFDENFADTLKNAFFIVEDEKFNTEYIDARLFEHITQTVMPGQFLTYDGKLYKVFSVSPEIGCVLHRAADSYTNRYYYRQLRTYHFGSDVELISDRRVMDVEIAIERRTFSVTTSGYLEMTDNHDLRTARVVDLSNDPCISSFDRNYKNKAVLRIALPDTDTRLRYTICMLLAEMFRSIFSEAWPYIAVLSSRPEDVEGMLDKFNYRIDGDIDENMIYIVEDSDMDLGLIEAVDNNIMRLFEIMSDYLDWHFEKMHEAAAKDPVPPPIEPPKEEEVMKRGFIARMARKVMRVFGLPDERNGGSDNKEKKKDEVLKEVADKEDTKTDTLDVEKTAADTEIAMDESPFDSETQEEKPDSDRIVENPGDSNELEESFELGADEDQNTGATEQQETAAENSDEEIEYTIPPNEQIVVHSDGEGLFSFDGTPDEMETELKDILLPIKQTRYQTECYLKFGFDAIDSRLAIEDLNKYLIVRGWGNNSLSKARKRTDLEDTLLDLSVENHCDFCGIPLSGVSYERLSDGRIRCGECSSTSINEVSEFKSLFKNAETMMESIFDITIPVAIGVKTTDAKTIARHNGQVFTPTTQVAARILGFAQLKNGKYSLFIENGSPRLASIDTTVHELTHIWQYINWKMGDIQNVYRQAKAADTKKAVDIVYEGMAEWAAIQLLYTMGETSYARQQEQLTAARSDIYGIGFRLYRAEYELEKNGNAPTKTPFKQYPPLDPAEVKKQI